MSNVLYGLVVEQEKRRARDSDRLFWQVYIRTITGKIKCFMWGVPDDVETNDNFPHFGNIIRVEDYKDEIADRQSIVINSFTVIQKEDLPKEHLSICEFKKASSDDYEWANNIIFNSSWNNIDYYNLVLDCINDVGKENFLKCPAATGIHHNIQNGLLIHTAEVANLAFSIGLASINRYEFINMDVILASAILHDIGKVKTYSLNVFGEPQSSTLEKTIGHLYYSMELVSRIAREKQYNILVDEILHCIAAHHGKAELGLQDPKTPEALIVASADYISSRNGIIETYADKIGGIIKEDFKVAGEYYHLTSGISEYYNGNRQN